MAKYGTPMVMVRGKKPLSRTFATWRQKAPLLEYGFTQAEMQGWTLAKVQYELRKARQERDRLERSRQSWDNQDNREAVARWAASHPQGVSSRQSR